MSEGETDEWREKGNLRKIDLSITSCLEPCAPAETVHSR